MARRFLRPFRARVFACCVCICLLTWLFTLLLQLNIFIPDGLPVIGRRTDDPPMNNLIPFHYLPNHEVCQHGGEPVEAVIVVHSDPRHPEVRDAIRRSLSQEFLTSLGLRRAFMLADASEAFTGNETTISQAVIDEENRRHRDIVQGTFHDSYHNLTYKHIMSLDWANTFCSQARMIIKMDDDVVYDVYKILKILKQLPHKLFLGGQLFAKTKPYRRGDSKWSVSRKYWPKVHYPPYVSGWLYFVSPDVSRALVLHSTRVPFFWIDDVYVTGMLAERLPITVSSLKHVYVTSEECVQYTSKQRFNLSQPSRSKVYKPSFVIGPSGKDVKAIQRFNELTRYCHKFTCHSRALFQLCRNKHLMAN